MILMYRPRNILECRTHHDNIHAPRLRSDFKIVSIDGEGELRLKSVLTTTKVLVRASLLTANRAFLENPVTDVTKLAATLHAPDSSTIRPVWGSWKH